MTLRTLLFPLVLVPSMATGCIVTKDMDENDSESTAASDSSESGSVPGDGASTTQQLPDDAGTTDPGPDDGASTTAMAGDSESGAQMTTAATSTDDGGGSESSTTASGDEIDCETSGGTWDDTSCGHYECGNPPACAAVIPGCDCGPTMNFVEGSGCVEDAACLDATFACGPALDCTLATEYCEVFHPGVPGPLSYSCVARPAACLTDATCMCLEDEGAFGAEGSCGDVPGGGLQVDIFGA